MSNNEEVFKENGITLTYKCWRYKESNDSVNGVHTALLSAEKTGSLNINYNGSLKKGI